MPACGMVEQPGENIPVEGFNSFAAIHGPGQIGKGPGKDVVPILVQQAGILAFAGEDLVHAPRSHLAVV